MPVRPSPPLPSKSLLLFLALTATSLVTCATDQATRGSAACGIAVRDAGRPLLDLRVGPGELRGGQTVLSFEAGRASGYLAGVAVRWRLSPERIQGSLGEASLDLAVAREGDTLTVRGPTDRGRLTARVSPRVLEVGNEQVLLELEARDEPGPARVFVDPKGLIEVVFEGCAPGLLQDRPEVLTSLALLLVGLPIRP
jgi:hypothetical protein